MLALSCTDPVNPPATPTTYERIVIETYPSVLGNTTDTYVDLFGAGGDPDADDPWTTDDTAQAIAWDDDGAPIEHLNYCQIDYTGGLTSGTYYIRVRHELRGGTGPYALRVLSLEIGDSLPAYDYPNVLEDPDPLEPDDNPANFGAPVDPVPTIEVGNTNWVNRWLDYDTEGDVDWFKLVLP